MMKPDTCAARVVMGVCVAVGAFASMPAGATERMAGSTVLFAQNRTLDDDLLIGGNNVEVRGRVRGDLVAAGGNVSVTGPVQKDVLACGATVTIEGPVEDDARAVGGTVILKGPVRHNATLAGGTVLLERGATVGRDASIAAGSVQIDSRITRNLDLSAGEARLTSEVGGTVTMRGEKLIVMPNAIVRGDVVYYGPARPEIQPGARVLGNVSFHPIEQAQPSSRAAAWPVMWLGQFLAFTILGLMLCAIVPDWLGRVGETVSVRTGASVLAGFLAVVAVPVICVGLLITLVGIPLAVGLIAVFLTLLLASGTLVAYPLGGWALGKIGRTDPSPSARMAAGVFLVSLLASVPSVGWVFQAIFIVTGTGAAIVQRFGGSKPAPKSTTVMAPPPAMPAPGPA